MKDTNTKERFLTLRAQGLSFDKIAQELKTSKGTLIEWSKELEIEISNLKAIELEALQEKYYILKRRRIELFGEKLEAIKLEVGKRNLEDVSTERLLDLLLRFGAVLKAEEVETTLRQNESEIDALVRNTQSVREWKP
jgi:transcriptional regulator